MPQSANFIGKDVYPARANDRRRQGPLQLKKRHPKVTGGNPIWGRRSTRILYTHTCTYIENDPAFCRKTLLHLGLTQKKIWTWIHNAARGRIITCPG